MLEEATRQQRSAAGLLNDFQMALRIRRLGRYGKHAAAKRAGFREGDIIISYAGRTNLMREADLLTYTVNAHKPGEKIPVTVIRGRRKIDLKMPIQK